MPLYRRFKSIKTIAIAVPLASAALFVTSCSHSGHDMSASETPSAASATTPAEATQNAQNKEGHQAGDGSHAAAHTGGVKTNHDVFHSKALEVPAGTPVPGITVDVEEDSVRGWNLYVGTANFTFDPEEVNGESRPTEGHAHLYINEEPIQRIYSTWTHLPTLPPGTNDIRVTLNANGHETLTTQGQPIEDSVTVEVYNPNASEAE